MNRREPSERWPWLLLVVALLVTGAPEANSQGSGYGHQTQTEADELELEVAGPYRDTGRQVRLLAPAAGGFRRMREAASHDGVELVPISGFRSRAYQARLFRRAVKKYGSEEKAARWVAPPGYSHHHTGLAVDIGDGSRGGCDVQLCFRETLAYGWLTKNGKRFGFHLFFTPDGLQGMDEPWHWHYTGEEDASQGAGPGAGRG